MRWKVWRGKENREYRQTRGIPVLFQSWTRKRPVQQQHSSCRDCYLTSLSLSPPTAEMHLSFGCLHKSKALVAQLFQHCCCAQWPLSVSVLRTLDSHKGQPGPIWREELTGFCRVQSGSRKWGENLSCFLPCSDPWPQKSTALGPCLLQITPACYTLFGAAQGTTDHNHSSAAVSVNSWGAAAGTALCKHSALWPLLCSFCH